MTNEINLRFILLDQSQREKWDRLVLSSPEKTIYQLSWYMDIISDGSWGIVTDENITTGLPIAFKKRTGYKNVYQPFYSMYFNVINPLCAIEEYLNVIGNEFHQIHITTQTKAKNAKTRTCQVLHLKKGISYSENAERLIKKARKEGLEVFKHDNGKSVVDLFRKNKGAELKEYKPKDFERLEKLIDSSVKHKNGFCISVSKGKQVLASGFFLTLDDTIIFLKGAVNDAGKKIGAMYLLMDHVITESKSTYTVFDFGGSNNKKVAEFYHKLGGRDITYNEILIDRSGPIRKVLKKILR